MAKRAVHQYGVSIRLACVAFGLSEKCYRYQAKLSSENQQIADLLIRLTPNHRNWGFGLCYLYVRNVKGLALVYRQIDRLEMHERQRLGDTATRLQKRLTLH